MKVGWPLTLDRVMNKYFETALFLKLRITLHVQFKCMPPHTQNQILQPSGSPYFPENDRFCICPMSRADPVVTLMSFSTPTTGRSAAESQLERRGYVLHLFDDHSFSSLLVGKLPSLNLMTWSRKLQIFFLASSTIRALSTSSVSADLKAIISSLF